MIKPHRCPHCGAKMVEYKHALSVPIVTGLRRLYERGQANLADLDLTRNQWDNFQKLRYWGLVEKAFDENGQRLPGVWKITDLGKRFLRRQVAIPKTAITYRGETVKREGPTVTVDQVVDGYWSREEFAALAAPAANAHGQLTLV